MGRSHLAKLHSLGMALQEEMEPCQSKATDPQLREPSQEDTVVDSIKGRLDTEEDQQRHIASIGFPQDVIL